MDDYTLAKLEGKVGTGKFLKEKLGKLNYRIEVLSNKKHVEGSMSISFRCYGGGNASPYSIEDIIPNEEAYKRFRDIVLAELIKYRDEVTAKFEAL